MDARDINRPHKAVLSIQLEVHSLLDAGECSGQIISPKALEAMGIESDFIVTIDGYTAEDCINKLAEKLKALKVNNKKELIASVEGEVERESMGYKVMQDDVIKCADCGLKLIQVIKVAESPLQTVIVVECPCGGTSFKYVTTGRLYMQAMNKVSISDMPVDMDDDGNMCTQIKVVKNE